MKREELAHVLRAAAEVTGEKEFVIIGSQAALAQLRALPGRMADSLEVDMYPRNRPELSELIEGALGKDSPFERTFHYYADGVSPDTASLPADWESRSVKFTAGDVVAVAPEIHDLATSKLLAGREKDIAWLETGLRTGLVDPHQVEQRIRTVPGRDEAIYAAAKRRLKDRLDLAPDPKTDALKLDPATDSQGRRRIAQSLDDAMLLRGLAATGQALRKPVSDIERMTLIEGYKLLRKEAVRRQLLFPENHPTPSPKRSRGVAGPSL